jgi:DNA primase
MFTKMEDEIQILLNLLEEILGDPKKANNSTHQYSYNCPVCDDGRGKGNFEINLEKSVYHCWSCGDTEGTHGPLGKLFDVYGTKKQKKLYLLVRPEEIKIKEKKLKKLKLPEGFTQFKNSNPIYPIFKQAKNYLISRGITDQIIEKYNIGFCDKGEYSGRIIVPSFDFNNQLNYFVARSWGNTKLKYKNPDLEKDKIIFNEHLIDWDNDIYLVEGVFDAFFLPNPIPMLGKHLSQYLFETLYTKANKDIIICLDGDAWTNATKLYHELNGGSLYDRIKIVKLPKDKDVCDLKGDIKNFYYKMNK